MNGPHRITAKRASLAASLVTALVGSLSILGPAPAAEAASCIKEVKSTVTLKSTDHETEQWTYISKSGKITVDPAEDLRPLTNATTIKVTIRSCVDKNGKRKVRDYQVTHSHADLKLTIVGDTVDPSPASGDTGYGVFVNKVTSSAIELQATECRADPYRINGWDALHGILSIPFPLPTPVAIGVAVAEKLLPPGPAQTYSCAKIGSTAKFKFKISSAGKVKLTTKKAIRYTSASWEGVCPAYRTCIGTDREVVIIKAA